MVLEIKNTVVVVGPIFLKYNGLCGQAISSFQLCSQSIPCMNFRARVTSFASHYVHGRNCARNL